MQAMYFFSNLNLIFLVVADALNITLALLVYRSNPRSATNRLFGILGAVISVWLVVLHAAQSPTLLGYALLLTRLSVFLAMPMTFVFFLFARTIPAEQMGVSRKEFWWFCAANVLVMAINMSPYAFTKLEVVGGYPQPITGPGLMPFAILSTFFSVAAVYILFRRYRRAEEPAKGQLRLIML